MIPSGGKVKKPGSYELANGNGDVRLIHHPRVDYLIGAGTLLHYLLNSVGFTKARWLWLKSWFIKNPTCFCDLRIHSYNRFQIIRPIRWLRHKLKGQIMLYAIHNCNDGKQVKLLFANREDVMTCPRCRKAYSLGPAEPRPGFLARLRAWLRPGSPPSE